ncbi:MAG: tetratricopeptide repeat protein [Phycisphaerales bacterium]
MSRFSASVKGFSARSALAAATLILTPIVPGCSESESDSSPAHPPIGVVNNHNLPALPDATVETEDPAVRRYVAEAMRQAQHSPKDPEPNGRLGMIYDVYSQPVAAAACYRRAAMLSGREFKWYYLLGRMQRSLGEANEAVISLNQAIAMNARYAPVHTALGEIYLELGETDKAEAAFRRALQIDERSCGALFGMGKVLAGKGDHPAALDLFRQGLALGPQYGPLHYAMGMSFRATGEMEQAKMHLGLANSGTKQPPDRDRILASVYAMDKGLDYDYRRSQAMTVAGDLDGAIELLRRIVAAAPDHYGARGRLAFALNRKGAASEALEQYQQAISLNPDNVDFLRPFALLLTRSSRLDEARKCMEHVIELGGDHADDYEVLGVILSMQNRRREAIEQFELSLKRDPTHTRSRKNLIKLLRDEIAAAPSDEAVLPYLIRYVEFKPAYSTPYVMLGRILDRQGDLGGALRAFDAALAMNSNIPEVRQRADEIRHQLNSTPPPSTPASTKSTPAR